MNTITQIKSQIYNAITGDSGITTNLGTRFYWMLRPETIPSDPFATFQVLDTVGSYVINGNVNLSHERVDIQITLYASYSDYAKFDALADDINRVMESIGYRLITSPEFIEESINKCARALRWSNINV